MQRGYFLLPSKLIVSEQSTLILVFFRSTLELKDLLKIQ